MTDNSVEFWSRKIARAELVLKQYQETAGPQPNETVIQKQRDAIARLTKNLENASTMISLREQRARASYDYTKNLPTSVSTSASGGDGSGPNNDDDDDDELESIAESAGDESARTNFGSLVQSDGSETDSSSGLVSASASFTGPSGPVPAFPSDESKAGSSSGLVLASASRGSRRRESSRSDPLRYSAAALGIRVMSAAESAERAAVEAADAERRANFFRANGLAP
jgi:hypothetical protein